MSLFSIIVFLPNTYKTCIHTVYMYITEYMYTCILLYVCVCMYMYVYYSFITLTLLGTCVGIVVNTGDSTIMGRIARLTGSIVQEREL